MPAVGDLGAGVWFPESSQRLVGLVSPWMLGPLLYGTVRYAMEEGRAGGYDATLRVGGPMLIPPCVGWKG